MANKLSPEQEKQLREPLPQEAIKPHPTKSYLSSIKAIYVVERLNKVFGIGSWQLKSEIIDNKSAMIVVKSSLLVPEYGIFLESYGGNDNGGENSKNFDLGDAYKGACTDALTKICSYLEIGIDVYKGKTSEKHPTTINNTDSKPEDKKELPWLNEGSKEIRGAIAKLSIGQTTVSKIKEHYRLSKKVEGVLQAAYKPAPEPVN